MTNFLCKGCKYLEKRWLIDPHDEDHTDLIGWCKLYLTSLGGGKKAEMLRRCVGPVLRTSSK